MQTHSGRKRFWRYAPLALWMFVISFASTSEFSAINTSRIIGPLLLWLFPNLSAERIETVHFLIRKAAHLTEYAVLGLLAARAFFASSHDLLRRSWFPLGFLLILVYGLLDEYHQSFVPSRTASLYDSAIDVTGGLVGLLVFAYFHRRANNRLNQGAATPLA